MSPKYKLTYFNVRGRGELIRLAFVAAGVQFEDERVEPSKWPELKPKTPHGTLPYLEIDGIPFGECMPLARYVARKYNLFGKNELDQLRVDIILNLCDELRNIVSRARNDKTLTDAQKADLENSVSTTLLPKFLEKMEKTLAENKHGYLVGHELTIADLFIYDLLELPLSAHPTLLDHFGKLKEHRKKIAAYPRLAKYLASRPVTAI